MRSVPAQHFYDGKQSGVNVLWCFIHKDTVVQIIASIIAGGWIAYFQFLTKIFSNKKDTLDSILTLYIIITLVAFVIWIIKSRNIERQNINKELLLHQVMHEVRSVICKAERKKTSGLTRNDAIDFLKNEFGHNICNHIRDYFKTILNKDVECAMRISHRRDNGERCYCTIGRSGGLNKNRSDKYFVKSNEGIPKFFLNEKVNCSGVLIIHDIDTATSDGIYLKTPNDHNFQGEISSLIVAPINGWDGDLISMLGLIYITSRSDIFNHKQVDSLRAISDVLGVAMSRIIFSLYAEKTKLININDRS